jgi:hypothetical protein
MEAIFKHYYSIEIRKGSSGDILCVGVKVDVLGCNYTSSVGRLTTASGTPSGVAVLPCMTNGLPGWTTRMGCPHIGHSKAAISLVRKFTIPFYEQDL